MQLAKIIVNETSGICVLRKRIPAGIVGATVAVEFRSPVWEDLQKTVVFRCRQETRLAEFDGTAAVVPHEVVQEPGRTLYFGIWGYHPETGLQLPLIEVPMGVVEQATDTEADPGADPALPIWAQLQQDVAELQEGLEEQVAEAIRDYLEKNPPEGGSGASPTITLSEFSDSTGSGVRIDIKNPDGKIYSYPVYNGRNGTSAFASVTKTGNVTTITTQDATGIKTAEVKDGVQFETDATLKLENGVLSVNTTGDVEQDNTLPITSAGVFATVGNIEALLKTI